MTNDTEIWHIWTQQQQELFAHFVGEWGRNKIITLTETERSWLIHSGMGETIEIIPTRPTKPTQVALNLYNALVTEKLV